MNRFLILLIPTVLLSGTAIGQTFSSVKPDPYLVFPHHNDWSMQHFHVHDQKYVQVH